MAHAFLPGDDLGGDVHFDEEEDWSFNSTGTRCPRRWGEKCVLNQFDRLNEDGYHCTAKGLLIDGVCV